MDIHATVFREVLAELTRSGRSCIDARDIQCIERRVHELQRQGRPLRAGKVSRWLWRRHGGARPCHARFSRVFQLTVPHRSSPLSPAVVATRRSYSRRRIRPRPSALAVRWRWSTSPASGVAYGYAREMGELNVRSKGETDSYAKLVAAEGAGRAKSIKVGLLDPNRRHLPALHPASCGPHSVRGKGQRDVVVGAAAAVDVQLGAECISCE